MDALSLREVAERVDLNWVEAVAIAQALIAGAPAHARVDAADGPSIDTVRLDARGAVACDAHTAAPDPASIGRLMYALLPADGASRPPGALRYTIARAMSDVDAPPFESLDALSKALARHEHGDRALLLRELYARAESAPRACGISEPEYHIERRRLGEHVAALRRELRRADQALFLIEQRAAHRSVRLAELPVPTVPSEAPPSYAVIDPPAPDLPLRGGDAFAADDAEPRAAVHAPSFRLRRWLAAGVMAAAIAFAAGYAAVPLARRAQQARPARPVEHAQALPAASPVPAARPQTRPAAPAPAVIPASIASTPSARAVPATDVSLMHAVPGAIGTTFSPSFASNGTALFFHTGQTSDSRSALEAADLRGDDLRVMTILDDGAKNYHVRPSPDGTRIAFDSDRDGTRGVYVAGRDGKHSHRVSGPGFAALPAWSPDGRSLAFVRGETDKPNVWNLWLLDLDSGAMRRLTSYRYGETWSASWFPDGQRIAYSHEDRLVLRDIRTGVTREIASPLPNRLVRTPAVSPDGKHVIFQVSGSGAWLLDVDTDAMRFVLTDASAEEFAWAPDGRRVAFHSRRDGHWGIWVMAPMGDTRG